MSLQNDNDWRITLDVPLSLPHEQRHYLLDRINASLGHWLLSFEDRDWDPFLSAGAADHTLEAYADRLEQQLEIVRQRLADAEERLHALRTAPRHRLVNVPPPPPPQEQTTIRQAEGNLPTPYPRPTEAQLDSLAEQALREMK